MSNKVNNIIREYIDNSGLIVEALPPLPDEGGEPAAAAAASPDPEAAAGTAEDQQPAHNMTDEAYVTAVKTMIELLSYGLHSEPDAIHRDPVAKWLRNKDNISKETAWDTLEEIDLFLAGPDSPQ